MRLLFLLPLLLLLTACPKRPFHRPRPSAIPHLPTQRVPSLPRSHAPERIASNDLLIRGTEALSKNNLEEATELFQESINLDPSNGATYYYLALTKSRAAEEEEVDTGEILDLLDRAESLLEGNEAWQKAIERLREEMLDGG